MLKLYNFNSLNESNDEGYSFDSAVKAAVDKGLGEPDHKQFLSSKNGKWNIAILTYGNTYDGERYVYSYESNKILNDEPFNMISSFNKDNNYLIVMKGSPSRHHYVYNFLDERGFTLKSWKDIIYRESDDDGYHIFEEDGMYNLIDVDGNVGFENPKVELRYIGDYLLCQDYDEDAILLDKNGKTVLDEVEDATLWNYSYYDDDEDIVTEKFYEFLLKNASALYNSKMELMASHVYQVDELQNNVCYASTSDDMVNIIGPGGKMIFGEDPRSKSGWLDSIGDYIDIHENDIHSYVYIIDRDHKYNLFDTKYMKVMFNDWCDEIHFIEMDYLGIGSAAAVLYGNECNMYILDPKNRLFKKFLFNEPVENIKTYDDFLVVTNNGNDYLLWSNGRMMMAEFDKIWKTEDVQTYTIMVDGKFDFIRVDEDETFCEKYMNGEKFDACSDFLSYYPLVEYKGKCSFVNIDMFEPAITMKKEMRWVDDADIAEYNEKIKEYVFPVKINGEDKLLNQYGEELDDDYLNG